MPIVFIHGVAVRREGDPGWEQVRGTTGSLDWEDIRANLARFVAPVLKPQDPDGVAISEIYWGDLGASYGLGGRSLGSWQPGQADWPDLATLSVSELGHRVEAEFLRSSATADWPEVIEAVWGAVEDTNVRSIMHSLPSARQWPFLAAAIESRLPRVELKQILEEPRLPRPLMVQRRRNMRFTFSRVRRPLEDFVPLFLGDVAAYLGGRGTPSQPGILMRRVLAGLKAAQSDAEPGEPLVVLTHSMGGQILYDALTTFLPADPEGTGVRVDFWCSCGGQVGLFRELGQFMERGSLPTRALVDSPHLGYFWNVWSISDLLSFRAEGIILGAHDTAFPIFRNVRADHLSYLTHAHFYRALAAKVKVHAGVPSRAQNNRPLDSGHDET